jgi:hypothetical protein
MDTIEQITEKMNTLLKEGWKFDLWSAEGGMRGWFFVPGAQGLAGMRNGDPKPFNLAVLAAWRVREYCK